MSFFRARTSTLFFRCFYFSCHQQNFHPFNLLQALLSIFLMILSYALYFLIFFLCLSFACPPRFLCFSAVVCSIVLPVSPCKTKAYRKQGRKKKEKNGKERRTNRGGCAKIKQPKGSNKQQQQKNKTQKTKKEKEEQTNNKQKNNSNKIDRQKDRTSIKQE